jgi:isopenicillin N synthase-like dioxygenase
LDNETTAGHADHREQLDLSTPHPVPGPEEPLYHNLLAPNQWPSSTHLPEFRPVFEEYIARLSELSMFFTALVAEALGMPATAFDRFFDRDQQHKLKIVKYPEVDVAGANIDDALLARQGVGPHKDSMLSSYLLQVSPQRGLQAQNLAGEWIDAVPRAGTLVVAFGQGLEALTGGVCASTTHRVLSPKRGEGPRFSVPFFQGVSYDARFEEMHVPADVRALRENIGGRADDVEFTFRPGRWGHLGEATLTNRVKSHPDVGERWVSSEREPRFSIGMLMVIQVPRAFGQDPGGAASDSKDDEVESKGRLGDRRLNALVDIFKRCIALHGIIER